MERVRGLDCQDKGFQGVVSGALNHDQPKMSFLSRAVLPLFVLMVLGMPAQAAEPGVNAANNAWLLVSSILVLLMSLPGLALFYGGMVRSKNMLSVLMQVFMIACLVAIIWVLYGYSLAFTNGGPWNAYVGGLDKVFLKGVTINSLSATFSNDVYIAEYVYICFQMTFAMITPALIVGAIAERVRFSALMVFVALWVTLVYCPIAHMVWYWAGPDALAKNPQDAGLLWSLGALDFAGGTVVHINAGIAGMVGCVMIGKRVGFGREAMPPHSLTMTLIGAALLWVGWFGFNAGSTLEANGLAALAMLNTFVATAAAAISWMVVEWKHRGKPSLLGAITGAVAGLVAITPPAGYASPMGALILGLVVSPLCYVFCTTVKNRLRYDDALDVFGVHCVGGIVGALGTAFLAVPEWGGQGFLDYTQIPAVAGHYDLMGQCIIQLKAVLLTLAWSGLGSALLYLVVDKTIGLRVAQDAEREGLDLTSHGERAYYF